MTQNAENRVERWLHELGDPAEPNGLFVNRPFQHVRRIHRVEQAGTVQVAGDNLIHGAYRGRCGIFPLEGYNRDGQGTGIAADDFDLELGMNCLADHQND